MSGGVKCLWDCAMQDMWHESKDNTEDTAKKYKTLQNVNIPGARFNSGGIPLFVKY